MAPHAITPNEPSVHTDRAKPVANNTRPAGPAAHLIALPNPVRVNVDEPNDVDAHLVQVQTARERQLDGLGAHQLDVVAAAYRTSIENILKQVSVARERLAAGMYGVCSHCNLQISIRRLELRPWATTCAHCTTSRA